MCTPIRKYFRRIFIICIDGKFIYGSFSLVLGGPAVYYRNEILIVYISSICHGNGTSFLLYLICMWPRGVHMQMPMEYGRTTAYQPATLNHTPGAYSLKAISRNYLQHPVRSQSTTMSWQPINVVNRLMK